MCLLLETIKLENGNLVNLKYHNQRFNKARKNLFSLEKEDLSELIQIPEIYKTGLFRCRILYQQEIKKIEFIPHQLKPIKSLQIVTDNTIIYSYKYADRTQLQKLYEQRASADDIIIIKNGLVTDCFIGNLVFFDGKNWLTPKSPLLRGTQRQKLLDEGNIKEAIIAKDELSTFEFVGIINVFYNLGNMSRLNKNQINY